MHPDEDTLGRDPAPCDPVPCYPAPPARTRWWPRAAQGRGRAAEGRLLAARSRFDLSVVALRKAALDHVDCQDVASVALHAVLHHLVACRTRYGGE